MNTALRPRVNIPLSRESKTRAVELARRRRISLSRFLQEAVEDRLHREARADLDRRLEQAAKEMAGEDRQTCREWEAAEADADRLA